jgi:magnesium transporter
MGQTHSRAYRKGELVAEGFPVRDVSEHLEDPDTVVWVDLAGAGRKELTELAGELGLHELAVEDAMGPHQRPKLDTYQSHLFMACYAVRTRPGAAQLDKTEIDVFISRRWMITVRSEECFFDITAVTRRWDRSTELAVEGMPFLLYGLLDVVIDGYFDVAEAFDDYYDEISETLFDGHPLEPAQQRGWFEARRSLVRFHRLVVPTREIVSSLMRRHNTTVSDDLYPYYQDVYDHILRVGETTDSLRELMSSIVETNLSLRDYRQNQITKMVSSWAAIIALPALITGYYGMNVPYPGSGTRAGWIWSLVILVGGTTGLYAYFRRRDWL